MKKKIPESLALIYCKRCGRIKSPEGYRPPDKESLAGAIEHQLHHLKLQVTVRSFDLEKKDKVVSVEYKFPVDGDYVFIDVDTPVTMDHQICLDDYRKSSGYYEAIIQLRGNKERIERMVVKITKFLDARGAFIGKIEETDAGIDLYTSDKSLTGKFFLFYKLKTKKSYTLYSIRKGKEIYRHTYLLRLD